VYREAIDRVLTELPHVTPPREQRDRIIALLTTVIFGLAEDINPETHRRYRQRRKPIRHAPDNSD
jgi:hypothetical protein